MGIIALGLAVTNLITAEEVEGLKQQIKEIMEQHQAITNKITLLAQNIKKLDLKNLDEKLSKMNQNLSQNLQTILQDQQLKLQLLSNIDLEQTPIEDPHVLLSALLNTLNVVFAMADLVELMFVTDPEAIAMIGLFIVVGDILNFLSILNNIQEIQELKAKKKELEEYFKPGGQFEQKLGEVATYTFQIIENFLMIVVGFRSMVNQLQININLLSLSNRTESLDYSHYISILHSNPFTPTFLQTCTKTYTSFLNIQSLPLQQKVNQSCRLLQQFQQQNFVCDRLTLVTRIANYFREDSMIGSLLTKAGEEMRKLTRLKERYQGRFVRRIAVGEMGLEELTQFDKELCSDLYDQARNMEDPHLAVVQVVSFYTTSFYADDKTGKTLFKQNLLETFQKTQMLNYLGITSQHQNLIILPKPSNQALLEQWQKMVNYLTEQYAVENPMVQFKVEKLYIRIEDGEMVIGGERLGKLNFYYGLGVRKDGEVVGQVIQREISEIFIDVGEKLFQGKDQIVEKVEKSSDNLKNLCSQLCFFINGIAYPDRVLSLSMTKEENNYKYALEWSKKSVKPEFFGKLINYSIEEGEIIQDKEKVLQVIPIKETNISILLKQR